MQPKRDPSDRRYWPARLGGTSGFGVQRYGIPSPRRYSALNRQGSLGANPHPRTNPNTVTDTAATVDAEAVKVRARLLALKLMDSIDLVADSMDASGLTDALNAAGKLAVDRASTVTVQGGIAHMHLDALREITQRAASRITLPDRAQPVDAHDVTALPRDRVNEDAGA